MGAMSESAAGKGAGGGARASSKGTPPEAFRARRYQESSSTEQRGHSQPARGVKEKRLWLLSLVLLVLLNIWITGHHMMAMFDAVGAHRAKRDLYYCWGRHSARVGLPPSGFG